MKKQEEEVFCLSFDFASFLRYKQKVPCNDGHDFRVRDRGTNCTCRWTGSRPITTLIVVPLDNSSERFYLHRLRRRRKKRKITDLTSPRPIWFPRYLFVQVSGIFNTSIEVRRYWSRSKENTRSLYIKTEWIRSY